jgi:hypothetical protein
MIKLNDLFQEVKPGHPVTSEELGILGVSADLAVHYVRAILEVELEARRLER